MYSLMALSIVLTGILITGLILGLIATLIVLVPMYIFVRIILLVLTGK